MANILVVDDHKAQRRNLAFYLKSQGYNTDNAETADEALARLENGHFDIVITDHKVTLDGLRLIRKSRSFKHSAEFIVVSGSVTVPMAVEFMHEGVADILMRPVEFAAIQSSVEKIIKKHDIKR